MSVAFSRHRVVLRAAVATAALAGALFTPAVAFAVGQGSTTASPECTVTKTIGSVFIDWTVDLTNSPDGPTAVLKDETGKAQATVDRAHPEDLANGLKIQNADTATPLFLDRSQGDPAPWRTTPFPALPDGCTTTDDDTNTPRPAGAGITQTRVVPAGGVAAGAESTEGTDTVLLAGGATLTAAGLAGLGFVVRRRRGTGAGV
ncbi:hypothetical protein [Streptomyces lancefieldiae]|uniref:Uncharacterized protein n=1 Tax=Streptomyces lancefieldiae TaxID=3075520 RepID=A0ABU3ATW6_9ACTN|nr:hypothetical protein [Streptomyces sp. DSM 40712]MDT0613627.1 hypothetical protein [Streptomyces sp. DSM 40712]